MRRIDAGRCSSLPRSSSSSIENSDSRGPATATSKARSRDTWTNFLPERFSTSRTHLGPELDRELDAWSEAGLIVPFWWRDDDAVTDTPALRTLLDTAREAGVTLAVGVVP